MVQELVMRGTKKETKKCVVNQRKLGGRSAELFPYKIQKYVP